jgi:hypothetical protein
MQIVWRNPAPPSTTKPQIEQLVADDYGAFELILGRQTEETADFTLRIRCCES